MRRYLGENGYEVIREVTVTPGAQAGTVLVVGPHESRTVPASQAGQTVVALSLTPVNVKNQPILPVTTDDVEQEIARVMRAIGETQSQQYGTETDLEALAKLDLLRNRLKALAVIRRAVLGQPGARTPTPPTAYVSPRLPPPPAHEPREVDITRLGPTVHVTVPERVMEKYPVSEPRSIEERVTFPPPEETYELPSKSAKEEVFRAALKSLSSFSFNEFFKRPSYIIVAEGSASQYRTQAAPPRLPPPSAPDIGSEAYSFFKALGTAGLAKAKRLAITLKANKKKWAPLPDVKFTSEHSSSSIGPRWTPEQIHWYPIAGALRDQKIKEGMRKREPEEDPALEAAIKESEEKYKKTIQSLLLASTSPERDNYNAGDKYNDARMAFLLQNEAVDYATQVYLDILDKAGNVPQASAPAPAPRPPALPSPAPAPPPSIPPAPYLVQVSVPTEGGEPLYLPPPVVENPVLNAVVQSVILLGAAKPTPAIWDVIPGPVKGTVTIITPDGPWYGIVPPKLLAPGISIKDPQSGKEWDRVALVTTVTGPKVFETDENGYYQICAGDKCVVGKAVAQTESAPPAPIVVPKSSMMKYPATEDHPAVIVHTTETPTPWPKSAEPVTVDNGVVRAKLEQQLAVLSSGLKDIERLNYQGSQVSEDQIYQMRQDAKRQISEVQSDLNSLKAGSTNPVTISRQVKIRSDNRESIISRVTCYPTSTKSG